MNFKRLISTLLIGCVAFSVTACSQVSGKSIASSSAAKNSSTVNSAKSEPIKITFWHSMDGVYADLLKKQVEQFNSTVGAQKGIVVTPVFQNYPGTDALTAAMSTDDVKNMPDVIQLYSESVNLIRNYKRTVKLEDYINRSDSSVKKSDLIPNAVSSYSIQGKMIGVPYNVSTLMLYYSKTLLKKAGYENPPKTIDEMAKMLPNLVSKANVKYGLDAQISEYELENWISTQGAGGSYFGDNESGHDKSMTGLQCDKDGTLMKFLTEWKKLVDAKAYQPIQDSSVAQEFAKGMYGMVIMTSSRIPKVDKLIGSSFDWDVASIPTVSSSDIGGAYPSGGGLFMLDRNDEARKDASWQFIQYMISPEAQTMWLQGTGYIPVNIHAQNLDTYKEAIKKQPKLQAPYNTLMKASDKVVGSFCPNSDKVNTVIKNAMKTFGKGSADTNTTYSAITQGCAKAIQDYYRANPNQK